MDGSTFSHFLIFNCNLRAKFAIEVGSDTNLRAREMKKNIQYETPVVEVLEAHVEKGFMGSGSNTHDSPNDGHGTQSLTEGETLFL